jgi:gamma-glutamyltranspeptidase / glutathione hydrolase
MRSRVAFLAAAAALAFALVACGGSLTPLPDPDPRAYDHDGTVIVVSSHPLATEAGEAILAAGGSAADAAVAIAAVLSVVEPWFSSVLGGGTWALHFDAATGRVESLDGVGPIGSLASIAAHAPRAGAPGMHQSVVPGAWDGWMIWLERYGRLPLPDVLAPAIAIAREGYLVNREMVRWLDREVAAFRDWPPSAAIYLPGGLLLREGDLLRQLDLADTLEELAGVYAAAGSRAEGFAAARDHVYRGPIAAAIVAASDQDGGYLTLADFANFAAAWNEPISIDFPGGITVYQNPPNSQGITMLMALSILAGYDLAAMDPDDPLVTHLQVEALKLAFADRHAHVGDPTRITVPVAELLSPEHAARQRARIDPNAALAWPIDSLIPAASPAGLATRAASPWMAAWEPDLPPPGEATGTTTFHVIDRDGNAAAVTTSLGAQFRVIGDTGIHINNRMRFASLTPGDSNQLTAGFKVRHTSNPYLALRDGGPFMLGGNTGADTQVQGQVQQFVAAAVFGRSASEAVAQRRFITTSFPATTYPFGVGGVLQLEPGFPEGLRAGLSERGHTISLALGVGVANVIVRTAEGWTVGAEPRSATATGVILPPP